MAKVKRRFVDDYNGSKDDFVRYALDDIVFLPPGEPILTGKQGGLTVKTYIYTKN